MKTLGIDLGGTKIAVAVVEDGNIIKRQQVRTPQTGFDDVLAAMATVAKSVLADFPEVARIGVGSPGPIDFKAGKIYFAPNIPGMENAPLVDGLHLALGLTIVLENDANAAGYAEHLYGAARELESSIYVTLSTGIGGGLFIGDKVIRGAHGVGGEIGHMTMNLTGPVGGDGHYGSLEAMAAGRSIARDGSYAYGQPLSTEEVFDRARAGEHRAMRIIDNAARYTGVGLANLQKILDPDAFVIGGGLAQVGDFYLSRIKATTEEFSQGFPVPRLLLAQLGTNAGVIGAAAVALPEKMVSQQGSH